MDDILEVIVIIGRFQQQVTSEKLDLGFMEYHIDIIDAVLLEETNDVLRGYLDGIHTTLYYQKNSNNHMTG